MSGNHSALFIHKDRIVEPKFLDRTGDLIHLFLRMRPGIICVRNQIIDQPVENFEFRFVHSFKKVRPAFSAERTPTNPKEIVC